jgi:hypothetical protein
MKLKSKAFTLVEVLLVSSLLAISGVAILRSFGNGLKLWDKAQRLNREAEVEIFFDKVAEDLRSAVPISGLAFKGMGSQISFPAVVITQADTKSSRAEEGLIDQIGAVQYRFDAAQHAIFRRQANYSQAMKGQWAQEERSIVAGIDALDIEYEVASDKGFSFKSALDEGVPSGLTVEVHFTDDNGEHQLKRYLPIRLRG